METNDGFLKDRNSDHRSIDEVDFYRFVIQCVPVGILTVNSSLKITRFNPLAEKITGYSEKEVIGRFCGEVLHGGMCDIHCPLKTVLGRKKPMIGIETTIQNKKGQFIPVNMNTGGLFDDDGNLVGGVEVFQDISHVKSLQRERENIISMIAHDMKSPVISIHGLAHRLLKKDGIEREEKWEHYLDIIEKESTKLELLINDFLELSRLHAGKLKLNFSSTSLDKELNELYEVYRPRAMEKGLELRLNSEEPLPIIEADAERLRRVFTNLLDNAIKFSKKSGTITVTAKKTEDGIMIKVKDEGIGIDPDDIPYIFESFHRVYRDELKEGFGLGLAGVNAIVKGHGGEVRVDSALGKGTVFTVILPKNQTQNQK